MSNSLNLEWFYCFAGDMYSPVDKALRIFICVYYIYQLLFKKECVLQCNYTTGLSGMNIIIH